MFNQRHTCLAGCGKAITWNFAICAECEKAYGRSPREWPEWLAFLWRDEQRMRRQDKRVRFNEETFVDLPGDIATDERNEDEHHDSE